MIDFVTRLGSPLNMYFKMVPGVYKLTGGQTPCGGGGPGIMNSDCCTNIFTGWRALDGGKWWLRSSAFPPEPSGDYTANAFLSIGLDPTASNIQFNDANSLVFSGANYLCSTNDFNTGLSSSALNTGLSSSAVVEPGSFVSNDFAQFSNPTQSVITVGFRSIQSAIISDMSFAGLKYACSGNALLESGNDTSCVGVYSVGGYVNFGTFGLQVGLPKSRLSTPFLQLWAITGGNMLGCPVGSYSTAGMSTCQLLIPSFVGVVNKTTVDFMCPVGTEIQGIY